MKKLFLFMLLAITVLAIAPENVNAQSKAKGKAYAYGAIDQIPVDFSAIGSNVTSIVLINEATNESFAAYSANGIYQVLEVPKHSVFTVWFYMANSEEQEINYQLKWDNTGNYIGITLQPGENRGVGTLHVELNKDSFLEFTRL